MTPFYYHVDRLLGFMGQADAPWRSAVFTKTVYRHDTPTVSFVAMGGVSRNCIDDDDFAFDPRTKVPEIFDNPFWNTRKYETC